MYSLKVQVILHTLINQIHLGIEFGTVNIITIKITVTQFNNQMAHSEKSVPLKCPKSILTQSNQLDLYLFVANNCCQ